MTTPLSPDTQAILLLTAPLIAGRGTATTAGLLSPGEYRQLARHLHELGRRPSDLVSGDADAALEACASIVEKDRLRHLLDRGFLLGQVVERWQSRAIWVTSRADPDYPARLRSRLREAAPAVIYGCGDRGLLESGGLGVVGSRDADEALLQDAAAAGALAADAGRPLVSGGARGVDQAAMRGALDAGGAAIGILADSLDRSAIARGNRDTLMEGRLTLVSPYDPSAGFNVGNAMQRNKLIYALADATLVVSSDLGRGGTWAGAVEQLDRMRLGPVYVRSGPPSSPGLSALQAKGALAWPRTDAPDTLRILLDEATATATAPEPILPKAQTVPSATGRPYQASLFG